MLRFRLVRWIRQFYNFFGEKEKPEHYMFTLSTPLTPEQIWEKLWPHGWGFNALSHTYRHQIYTVRKLVPPHHQYHLRFYDNGDVTGHFEVEHTAFPLEHLDGVELRALTEMEKIQNRRLLA